jgi:hypothetical protein
MEASKSAPLVHKMSQDEFLAIAVAIPLTNHGRAWEVFVDGHSFGFADDTKEEALVQVHEREVNNALYENDERGEAGPAKCELPSATALRPYPHLLARFPAAVVKMLLGPMEPQAGHQCSRSTVDLKTALRNAPLSFMDGCKVANSYYSEDEVTVDAAEETQRTFKHQNVFVDEYGLATATDENGELVSFKFQTVVPFKLTADDGEQK